MNGRSRSYKKRLAVMMRVRTVTVRMRMLSVNQLTVVRMTVLEVLEVMQRLFAVEELDVSRLRRGQAADGPAEMNEVRLDWRVHGMHPDLVRQTVRLAGVARTACRNDVRPVVRSAARQRNEMVARQRLARLELDLKTAAILAAVAIAREEEGVRHLAAETAGHVDEPRQPDDCRARQRQPFGANHPVRVRLDYLGFAVNDQP